MVVSKEELLGSFVQFVTVIMYGIAQLFVAWCFGGGVASMASSELFRYRQKGLPQNTSHLFSPLSSKFPQEGGNVESLIEKLLLNGDLISAETLWKAEMDSVVQAPTPDSSSSSKNAFVANPINFKTTDSFLMTRLELTGTFSIYFKLKTTKRDGLLMYAGPLMHDRQDFMALELVGGIVRFVFDVGTGIRVVRSNRKPEINDNEWHDVGILRPTLTQHILRVDDSARPDPLPDEAGDYDLSDEFYVGGLSQHLYDELPKQVKSRHGFQGCFGSIDLNGGSQDLMEDGRAILVEGNIVSGCEDPSVDCSASSCNNGGLCIQHLDTLSCDCELTSFTGSTCDDDGVAYTFGEGGGLIRYNYTEGLTLNPGQIRLAFGIHTSVTDAVLLHFESQVSRDYFQLELVDGSIVVVHNVGNKDYILRGSHRVNDGAYHTVRFIRNDHNSTLQVDDHSSVHRFYEEKDGLFGGATMTVYIGSQAYPKNGLVKPFYGSIAGLVINSVYVLEQIADGEDKVSYIGNVVMEIRPLRHFQSLATLSPTSESKLYQTHPYTDIAFVHPSEGPRHPQQFHTTLQPQNRSHPFLVEGPFRTVSSRPDLFIKSTKHHQENRFGTSRKAGHQPRTSSRPEGYQSTARPEHHWKPQEKKPFHDNSDDLIVTRLTTECPPEVNLDCPILPARYADAFLYPATRLSKHRKPLRVGPPTIHPFNTPIHKETSGSKPCFPDDDEDCDVYSGNGGGGGPGPGRGGGGGGGIVIIPLKTTKSTAPDDIIYIHRTQSAGGGGGGSKDFKDASSSSPPSASTLIFDKTTQREMVQPRTIATSTTTTLAERMSSQSTGGFENHRSNGLVNTLATQPQQSKTSSSEEDEEEVRIKQVMFEDAGRNANSAYIDKLTMNIGLIIGIAIGIALLLLVLAFALYKYKTRNELPCNGGGSDTKGYVYETCNTLPPTPISTGPPVKTLASPAPQITMATTAAAEKPKRRDVKEWYV